MSRQIVQVALDLPVSNHFDYLAPSPVPQRGERVRVPFGRAYRCGVVVGGGAASDVPPERMREIAERLDDEVLLDENHLEFLQWAASYYHHPLGEVLLGALPVRLRRGERALALGEPAWQLTRLGRESDLNALIRAPRQRAVVAEIRRFGGLITRRQLSQKCGNVSAALRALMQRTWIEPCTCVQTGRQESAVVPGPQLNVEQEHAVAAASNEIGRYAAFVLDGVTGSGKTEVYIRLIEEVLAYNQTALVLVPEISLTPQLVGRFERRLGAGVLLQHSGLNERARERAWQAARSGRARVLIGTRSAVLNPLANLGLIIVDEEHDPSFKQQDGFRYSARDLAVVRAQRANAGRGCPIVLGSATPSLESLHNATLGRYRHLRLRQRAGGAELPPLALLDIRSQSVEAGVSTVLLRHLDEILRKGDQALVFLNRRGYAPVLSCYDCGWVSDCPRCDARQTFHSSKGLLWCHHCGAQRRAPSACPQCGHPEVHALGQGTERLEEFLRQQFPDYPLLRVDRDATRRKGSLEELLRTVKSGDPALLVGTQMLAKGHHFPKVTLVGVLDVDGGLFGADFRAAERTAQLVLQVAGRAGRGSDPGKVLIQTRFPEHPLLQLLVKSGYDAFVEASLAERREARLPPYSYQGLFRAEATRSELPSSFLNQVLETARELASSEVEIWGPVPAPMERRAGRFRAHLLLQAVVRRPLHRLLQQLLPLLRRLPLARKVRWSLDVDPIDLL